MKITIPLLALIVAVQLAPWPRAATDAGRCWRRLCARRLRADEPDRELGTEPVGHVVPPDDRIGQRHRQHDRQIATERILRRLQCFDPPGVAARSLSELGTLLKGLTSLIQTRRHRMRKATLITILTVGAAVAPRSASD